LSASAARPMEASQWKRFFSLDNRYIAPIFITLILLVGHLSFGILESYHKTLLAIVASIGTELILSRLFFGKWPNIASAYITTSNGKRVGFTACRRRGNVSAQLPRMTAITPLEIRQAIGAGGPNNINSGGRIEPNVVMNPS